MIVDTETEINIKDLLLEEPQKKELVFDAEQEIRGLDRIKIDELFDTLLSEQGDFPGDDLMSPFASLRILGLEESVSLPVSPLNGLRTKYIIASQRQQWVKVGHFLAEYKTLFGSRGLDIPTLQNQEWLGLKANLNRLYEDHNWVAFAHAAADMLVTKPDQQDDLGLLNPEIYQDLTGWLNQAPGQPEPEITLPLFAETAKNLRLLYPNQPYPLSVENWQKMKDVLRTIRGSDNSQDLAKFLTMAANMKMLAAQDLKVTDQGLELGPPTYQPEVLKIKNLDLPETRSF